MIIKAGNYTRVQSDAEMLLTISLFAAAGFPFWSSKITVRQPDDCWRLQRQEDGEDLYIFASRDGNCNLGYLENVHEEKHPVQIYLPNPETLLQRYVYNS